MKNKLLYALAGALFSLAVVGFFGFKASNDVGNKYVVVSFNGLNAEVKYAYEDGNTEVEKLTKVKLSDPSWMPAAIAKMDAAGYDLFLASGYLIFKKR